MAITNVQTSGLKSTSGGGGISWTPGTALTVNNLLTFRGWNYNTAPANGDVKDSSGTPKTFAMRGTPTSSGGEYASIAGDLIPSGVTSPVNNANASSFNYGVFDEWTGNATTSVFDLANTSGPSSATPTTPSITVGANAGIVLAALNCDNGSSGTITSTGTSFTQDASAPSVFFGAVAYRLASVTGSISESWTIPSPTSCSVAIASFNASSGGGSAALSTAGIAGIGTVSGTLAEADALSSEVDGIGTVAGALTTNEPLAAGGMAGIGTVAGSLSEATALASSIAGIGTVSGNLTIPGGMTGNVDSTGTVTGTLTGGSGALSGESAGIFAINGAYLFNPNALAYTVWKLMQGVGV